MKRDGRTLRTDSAITTCICLQKFLWGHKKLSRGPLDNIKALGLVVSDKNIFYIFSLYKPM